ncbi:phosphoglucomutase/phosphomannomutase, alpha/beta/alpha domain II family protein [Mycobacterium xenopi 4042]|uniref:Phosphoglucomutase/phosphomannomutase, alpha/beta/alpha domain II family protein n=1 Tax=Mycobacterium xenopi 4042 TaxID=1299334 RepID=X7YJU3_MYCXE|nr:phosphoglucomutase/phosphomannomutase, alpha/beta/alpha domain II family protein [Mycobacterium xenopi 4042]
MLVGVGAGGADTVTRGRWRGGGRNAAPRRLRRSPHRRRAVRARPDFPTVAFPNPEEPGATDALLRLAHDFDADIAVALDPTRIVARWAYPRQRAGGCLPETKPVGC